MTMHIPISKDATQKNALLCIVESSPQSIRERPDCIDNFAPVLIGVLSTDLVLDPGVNLGLK